MNKNSAFIVEITDSHIKFLQCRKRHGKIAVDVCEVRAFHKRTDEEVSKLFSELLLSRNVKVSNLILVIPRRLTIQKVLNLPSSDPYEISKMIPLQLVNKIPYALKDVIYDHRILEKNSEGYSKVLVSVIHKEICDRYLGFLKNIGISLSRLTISSEGIFGWHMYQQSKSRTDPQQLTAVINIDAEQTEVCFCNNQKIFFSRNIKYGAKDLVGEYLDDFVKQIQVSFETYTKDQIGPLVSKALIVSSLPDTHLLKDKLERELKMSVDTKLPADNVSIQKNSNAASLNTHRGISLTVCVGIMFSLSKIKMMNLTPKEVHESKVFESKKQRIIQFVVLIVVVIALGISIIGVELFQKMKVLSSLEEKVEEKSLQVEKSKHMIKFVDYFNHQLDEKLFIPDIMHELYKLTPSEISFRSLLIDESGLFTVNGYAEQSGAVNSLRNSLVGSKVFNNVTLHYSTKRKIFNMDITDFKITAELLQKKVKK